MEHGSRRISVRVEGAPRLVVDATTAALRGHGLDAWTGRQGATGETTGREPEREALALVLLVPAGAEAVWRALVVAGDAGLPWGAVVDGRGDSRYAATADALLQSGASWVLSADAGLEAVVAAVDGSVGADATPACGVASHDLDDPDLVAFTPASMLASLSADERVVLDAMAHGRSVGDTASRLGTTAEVVDAHRQSLQLKLGSRSQVAAVALLLLQETDDVVSGRRPTGGAPGRSHPGARVQNLR